MNSISDNWYSTKRANTTYFYCGPSSKNENEKRVNEKQNMRMDKSKANTLIYIHMYIYTYSRITDTHTHYLLFKSDRSFWHCVWKYLNYSLFKLSQASCSKYRDQYKKMLLSHVFVAKRIFKFRKVISCAYLAIWSKFKNYIHIIRTSVIDKIQGYSPRYVKKAPPKLKCVYFMCLTTFSQVFSFKLFDIINFNIFTI